MNKQQVNGLIPIFFGFPRRILLSSIIDGVCWIFPINVLTSVLLPFMNRIQHPCRNKLLAVRTTCGWRLAANVWAEDSDQKDSGCGVQWWGASLIRMLPEWPSPCPIETSKTQLNREESSQSGEIRVEATALGAMDLILACYHAQPANIAGCSHSLR